MNALELDGMEAKDAKQILELVILLMLCAFGFGVLVGTLLR